MRHTKFFNLVTIMLAITSITQMHPTHPSTLPSIRAIQQENTSLNEVLPRELKIEADTIGIDKINNQGQSLIDSFKAFTPKNTNTLSNTLGKFVEDHPLITRLCLFVAIYITLDAALKIIPTVIGGMRQKYKQGQLSPLHIAAGNRSIEMAEKILQPCPKDKIFELLTTKDNFGRTALIVAAHNGFTGVVEKILQSCPQDKIFELLAAEDWQQFTALHCAAIYKHKDVMKILIDACPTSKKFELLTKQSYLGATALHCAAHHENAEEVKTLLDSCPQDKVFELLSCKDKAGDTALHYAKENVIKTLIDACPTSKKLELLSAKNPKEEKTALDCALHQGDVGAAEALLDAYESVIFSAFENKNQVHLEIRRDIAQEVFIALKNSYEKLKNNPAVDEQIKTQIKDHISNIFAHCIYAEEKIHTVTADDKATLNSQIAALLDADATIIVPELIRAYFRVLTKEPVVKEYKEVDTVYFGTPDQLHFNITAQKLANSTFEPSNNGIETMKNNLATTKKLFDMEFVFE